MLLLLVAIAVYFASGVLALLAMRTPRIAGFVGMIGAVMGSLLALVGVGRFLLAGGRAAEEFTTRWPVPGASFTLGMDSLTALFLIPTFVIGAACAIYAQEYLFAAGLGDHAGRSWLFFNVLVGGIALVFLARNAVLFLVAWEIMTISSFFLVTLEDDDDHAREAGWIYLVASHAGTACLIALFALLGDRAGSLDFGDFAAHAGGAGSPAGALFVLTLVGFGVKAGLMPLHVWLPEAHPAAPSHVSALMSGVMIKTGVYGIVRMLPFLGPASAWWAWTLICAGAISAVAGVVFALAQRDLKRLLAYSSVENIGIITMGLGVGVLGASSGTPWLMALGFAGALLHVVNHAIFKGLLFLGAGSVLTATGTCDLERLGGLLRLASWTGWTFLIGAAAIAGLPPFNGFVSEFLILTGALQGVALLPADIAVPLLIVAGSIVFAGGLASVCFARAFGVVFLGAPRAKLANTASDPGGFMKAPMIVLAAACPAIGLLSLWIVPGLDVTIPGSKGGFAADAGISSALAEAGTWLAGFAVCATAIVILTAIILMIRAFLLRRREVRDDDTWACGYPAVTPRMQYTAASFAEPLTSLFRPLLRTRGRAAPFLDLFARPSAFSTETPDLARVALYAPLIAGMQSMASRLRGLQRGRLQLYVLYVAVTIVALMLWEFAWNR